MFSQHDIRDKMSVCHSLFDNGSGSLILRFHDIRFFAVIVTFLAFVDFAALFDLVDLFGNDCDADCDIFFEIRNKSITVHFTFALTLG